MADEKFSRTVLTSTRLHDSISASSSTRPSWHSSSSGKKKGIGRCKVIIDWRCLRETFGSALTKFCQVIIPLNKEKSTHDCTSRAFRFTGRLFAIVASKEGPFPIQRKVWRFGRAFNELATPTNVIQIER